MFIVSLHSVVFFLAKLKIPRNILFFLTEKKKNSLNFHHNGPKLHNLENI